MRRFLGLQMLAIVAVLGTINANLAHAMTAGDGDMTFTWTDDDFMPSSEPPKNPITPDPKPPEQPPPTKHWAKSKTMWFNIGVTVLGIGGVLFPVADSVLPFAKPFMNEQTFAVLTALIGAGNVALRTMTQSKITLDKTE